MDIGGLDASLLTHLAFWPHSTLSPGLRLGNMEVVKVMALTRLKKLELWGWRDWDDLAPLGGLPLEELSCESCCMLLDIIGAGCLGNLKVITLANYDSVNLNKWLSNRGIDHERALTLVSEALLKLPTLSTLEYKYRWHADSEGNGYLDGGGSVFKIATLHPEHWRQVEGESGRLLYRVRV